MQVYSEATTASLLFTTVVAAFIEMIFTMFTKQEECIVALPMIELSLKYIG